MKAPPDATGNGPGGYWMVAHLLMDIRGTKAWNLWGYKDAVQGRDSSGKRIIIIHVDRRQVIDDPPFNEYEGTEVIWAEAR
jgi:hypothetical protein